MNEKKKVERFYLEEFFKLLGEEPEDMQAGEAPDFTVKLRQTKLGIELTEFHSDLKGKKGLPRRAIEETWASLQRIIMEEVKEHKELEKTNGYLSFKELELPATSEYRQFVSELIKLSLEMIASACKEIKPGTNYPLLNKYLAKFCLEKVGCYITWEWDHNFAWVGLTETELIDAIRTKIEKIVNYKQKDLDELWLLIISGHRLSQDMGRLLEYKLNNYSQLNRLLKKSGYSKVYIYQYMLNVIYQWPGWSKIGTENLIPTIRD